MKQKLAPLVAVLCLLLCSGTLIAAPDPAGAYITEWDLSKQSNNTTLRIGFGQNFSYQYYWENIDNPTQNSGNDIYQSGSGSLIQISNLTANGKYRLYIKGITRIDGRTSQYSYQPGLSRVISWGNIAWTNLSYAFYNSVNLIYLPAEAPDLSNGPSLEGMFYRASVFNQNIGNWNTANVTNMLAMFWEASAFNQPIDNWNTANVTNMAYMFQNAIAFNQNIGNWNTANVTSMAYMFYGARAFNQNIGSWNTANVTSMTYMFQNAIAFNQNISNWNTSNVTNMTQMFVFASAFNQPIGNWNTANVTYMSGMFYGASAFNQNIGNWNTENVTNMAYIFYYATAFNQNLGNWSLNNSVTMTDMLSYSGMDCGSYSATLNGWNTNYPNLTNRSLGSFGLTYNSTAQAARQALLSRGWTISGDTYNANCVGALPVHFGDISATIGNGQLTVNWRTLSETENSHFDIEATTDGTGFTTIGSVKSLAKDGNADTPLSYTFSNDTTAVAGLLAASLVLISMGCVASKKRKQMLLPLFAATVLITFFAGCSKKATSVDSDYSRIFIRIKQVDKDGGFTYSKLVKVVQQ